MDTVKFCTGSKYTGSLSTREHTMSGLGTYTYPDGSIYSGNFRAGRFNGNGRLKLAEPYNMTFTGIFVDGSLVNIQGITFNDGLRFYRYNNNGEREGSVLENWIYCTTGERRFLRELFDGLSPATSDANPTAAMTARSIRDGYYDTEEGFYWPVSGFVNSIAPTLSAIRFLECGTESEWIKTHCRYGGNSFAHCKRTNNGLPLHPICPEIIKNNLLSMQEIGSKDKKLIEDACACTQKDLKQLNLCEDLLGTPNDDVSSVDRAECFLTQSNSSFGMDSLNLWLKQNQTASLCTPASSMSTLNQEDSESYIWSYSDQGRHKTEEAVTDSESIEAIEEICDEETKGETLEIATEENVAEAVTDDADELHHSHVVFNSHLL